MSRDYVRSKVSAYLRSAASCTRKLGEEVDVLASVIVVRVVVVVVVVVSVVVAVLLAAPLLLLLLLSGDGNRTEQNRKHMRVRCVRHNGGGLCRSAAYRCHCTQRGR